MVLACLNATNCEVLTHETNSTQGPARARCGVLADCSVRIWTPWQAAAGWVRRGLAECGKRVDVFFWDFLSAAKSSSAPPHSMALGLPCCQGAVPARIQIHNLNTRSICTLVAKNWKLLNYLQHLTACIWTAELGLGRKEGSSSNVRKPSRRVLKSRYRSVRYRYYIVWNLLQHLIWPLYRRGLRRSTIIQRSPMKVRCSMLHLPIQPAILWRLQRSNLV